MTEVSFAKSFLTALDSRPVKLSPDHVEDPKSYPARSAYILPKMPKTMSKRTPHAVAPGQERSLTVLVKSLRNPPLDIKLTSQTPNTSILDIKTSVSNDSGIPVDKMKILHKKKPIPDSKVLKDLAGEDDTSIEFSVMVMGGAAAIKNTPAHTEVAQGPSGGEVLETKEFWDDLKGFLLQRIRDEKTAGELADTFQAAWKARS
ncbi:cell-cycle control medial ring component-domain-containing protein [Annulohypoxylon maeteangense]|uniref:cell-cycle control medial ring component-domain-containing protein n=1 Tax=Annulohypoxylon maeteangense TaxID=1927788 RepID=UPI002007780A|nr:cell-cycle control medial ring component-domain-containing protein [Annulohypoxylon maeteangense]KAI0884769.1 cell-cycle control medial ring component-domain-containing protein [Annulohypoxylon maeteangense]